jgi:hypothetical protein
MLQSKINLMKYWNQSYVIDGIEAEFYCAFFLWQGVAVLFHLQFENIRSRVLVEWLL